ncbi:D-inositol 3-phosphate glycosyltransferase-like isoform X1 [Acropora muricata]|uniref:D-inositol 3-phosphate glycosyltransferase-like isoform X1 n=2 Tax=Acropora muricata TaxID=159855 RepID=UPI0034E46842
MSSTLQCVWAYLNHAVTLIIIIFLDPFQVLKQNCRVEFVQKGAKKKDSPMDRRELKEFDVAGEIRSVWVDKQCRAASPTSHMDGPAPDFSKAKDEGKLNVALVTDDEGWKITVTDQLLTELANNPSVKLSGVVEKTNPELEAWAKKLNIKLVLPLVMAGFDGKDTLSFPPDDLDIDVLIIHSYGYDLGRQAQIITRNKKCTWVQVVHTVSQELAKYGEKKIYDHDHDHQVQLDLCKRADMIIAIGPKVAKAYGRHLRSSLKEVFDFTPGINDDLINARSVVDDEEAFWIKVSASYYEKYFEAKGLDVAAKAINLLRDTSYHILFLVKPNEDPEKLQSRLETHLDKKQFTVEQFEKNTDNFKTLLCRVQLAILPSREEGFGTSILPALSADVPVLISGNTGLGMAVKELSSGPKYIIYSNEPEVWAEKIKEVRKRGARKCSIDAQKLRKEYMAKYSTQKQCHSLVKKMRELFADKQGDTQGITQGPGSNESVEDTRNKVETTVSGDTRGITKGEGCDVPDAGKKNRSGKKFCMFS